MTLASPAARGRELLDRHLPGLGERLAAAPLSLLESPDSPALGWFKEAGGPGLLIEDDLGGGGVSLADALHVQRAIGALSPSLAVATTMHHFSVASILEVGEHGAGLEWLLLEAVARNRFLVASGVSEGAPGRRANAPAMVGERADGGYVLTGTKRPCSLSRSMDLLTASFRLEGDEQAWGMAVVAADSDGLRREPFWSSPTLAGAESDAVVLDRVFVPDRLVEVFGESGTTSEALRATFVWFELLISSAYLGAASGLVELALARPEIAPEAALGLLADLEGPMLALERVALGVGQVPTPALLGPALVARAATESAIERITTTAVRTIGGSGYFGGDRVATLAAAARCLAFHPPSVEATAAGVLAWVHGRPIEL